MAVLDHSFRRLALLFATAHCFIIFAAAAAASADQQLTRVQDPDVIFDTDPDGDTLVYSPLTGFQIPQGLASDGGGSGFSSSAVLWIIFSFVVGTPLLLLGFRGRRLTLGAAVGTAAALASWSVVVNTLDNVGVSDLALTFCIFVLFLLAFPFGCLNMTRTVGILVLGILGGLAIGVRIILMGSGLLISDPDAFFVNWLIIGICGIAGSILVAWNQRFGILNGCASTGSFLCALGFDLAINQQSGMSRGLRFLIDRNRYHALDTMTNGYVPPLTTVVILAVSLGITPAFAFAQWKAFKCSFNGPTFGGSLWEPREVSRDEESITIPQRSVDLPDTPTTEKPCKPSLSDNPKEGRSS